jgi:hypothetical protein
MAKKAKGPILTAEIKRHIRLKPRRFINDADGIEYIVSECCEEMYQDVKEVFKGDLSKKVITPILNIDALGNWSMGLRITNKD